MDYCDNRDDILVGLRHLTFDHEPCRQRLNDSPDQLAAIDSLVELLLDKRSPF
jgi:hypothetical protein